MKLLLLAGIAAGVWWMRKEPAAPERGSVHAELVTDLEPGEEIDLSTVTRADQWTVLEFGAPW